jgi:hypothetical protein
VSAELEARRTAAAAILADYQRAVDGADVVDRAMWGARLADALGYLLAAPAAVLPPAQLSTVLAALHDAATLHTERAAAYCLACSEHPARLCDEHFTDLDEADAYRQVAQEIGDQR